MTSSRRDVRWRSGGACRRCGRTVRWHQGNGGRWCRQWRDVRPLIKNRRPGSDDAGVCGIVRGQRGSGRGVVGSVTSMGTVAIMMNGLDLSIQASLMLENDEDAFGEKQRLDEALEENAWRRVCDPR
ncbi:hypothetical protein ACLOJK_004910 [Asimina triloba]